MKSLSLTIKALNLNSLSLTRKSLSLKLSELGIANYTKALKFTKGVERRDLKVSV